MRERDVEKYFSRRVQELGGKSWKWSSPSQRGVPDRIAMFPGGKIIFAEIKRHGGVTSKLQNYVGSTIILLGFEWVVLSSFEEIDNYFKIGGRHGYY
jgi:hypothetical protein